jgi:Fe-coproporphyrin III synthase
LAARNDLIAINAPPLDIERHRLTELPVLVFHAHTSCNCCCVMCDIWKTKDSRSLSHADLQPHLESIRRLGVRWVVLSGGEPLLNAEWPQLCSIFRQEGIRVTLLTTGLLLGKQASLVAEFFDDVIVSLDGPEQIHDQIRRVDKAFALLQRGVAALRHHRRALPISARTTVQKANHAHLRETCTAAKQLNVNGISFLAADLTSEAFNRPLGWSPNRQSEVALSVDEVAVLETEIESLITKNFEDIHSGFIAESPEKLRRIVTHFRAHLGLDQTKAPRCNAPWTSAVVETDGTVRPCFFHPPIGNIHHAPLEEVVNGDQALTFRSKLDIPNDAICERCVCSLNYRS